MAADEENDEEDRQRNAEEPEECVAADAAGLFGEMLDGFHAPESARTAARTCLAAGSYGRSVCRFPLGWRIQSLEWP